MNDKPPVLNTPVFSHPNPRSSEVAISVFRDTRVPGYAVPKFRTPYPDAPYSTDGYLLTEIKNTSPSGIFTEWVYEKIPGPVAVEITADQANGIPILISRQRVPVDANFVTGLFTPPAQTIAAVAGHANPCEVTLAAPHWLSYRMWVSIAGTGTSLDGAVVRVIGLPTPTSVLLDLDFSTFAGGTGGTLTPVNPILRELLPTANPNILMKVESMLDVTDLTPFNQDVKCRKDYNFPDFLISIDGLADLSTSTSTTGGALSDIGYVWNGGIAPKIQSGYRGPCDARRLRFFFVGPPPDSFYDTYPITRVNPSVGVVIVKGGSFNIHAVISGGTVTEGQSTSWTYRAMGIPSVLHAGVSINKIGSGQAEFTLFLPPSEPSFFHAGDIINLVDEPIKWQVGVWEIVVYLITVPADSGS